MNESWFVRGLLQLHFLLGIIANPRLVLVDIFGEESIDLMIEQVKIDKGQTQYTALDLRSPHTCNWLTVNEGKDKSDIKISLTQDDQYKNKVKVYYLAIYKIRENRVVSDFQCTLRINELSRGSVLCYKNHYFY